MMKNCSKELKKLDFYKNSNFLKDIKFDSFEACDTINYSKYTSDLDSIEKSFDEFVEWLQTYSFIESE